MDNSKFDKYFQKYWDKKLKEFIIKHKDKPWNNQLAYLNKNISWNVSSSKVTDMKRAIGVWKGRSDGIPLVTFHFAQKYGF